MIISCLGDSLTEGDYGIKGKRGIANVKEKNYPFFLSEELKCEVRNYGKCGFRADDYLNYYLKGNVDLTGTDIVLVMLGTNGGHSIQEETASNLAYEKLLQCLKKDAPEAENFLITPPHVTQNPKYSNCGYYDQVEDAVRFVRKLAEKTKLPILDAANYQEFCEENEDLYQANDGLHFVEEGYRKLASWIAQQILERK